MKLQLKLLILLTAINTISIAEVEEEIDPTNTTHQFETTRTSEEIRFEKKKAREERIAQKKAQQRRSISSYDFDEPIQNGAQTSIKYTRFLHALRDVQRTNDYAELHDIWNNEVKDDPEKVSRLVKHIQTILSDKPTRNFAYDGLTKDEAYDRLTLRDLPLISQDLSDAHAQAEELAKTKRRI